MDKKSVAKNYRFLAILLSCMVAGALLGWFKPKNNIDFNGWHVEGDFPGWDITITQPVGETVAQVSKELLQWTDTYVLDIVDPADALHVLMFAQAIDAEKCSAK